MFVKFRKDYSLKQEWPASHEQIVLFIAHCFESGLSPRSIKTYISGLNYFHKLNGWFDMCDNFLIKKLLEGCSRSRVTKDNRAPITKRILLALITELPKICYNEFETKLFTAIWVLAYFGLFRVSELVAPGNGTGDNQLRAGDVQVASDGRAVLIELHTFKTNHNNFQR